MRAIPLRHPPVFYEGHIPAFSFNKLVREALGRASIDAAFERLFERGIDPADAAAAAAHARSGWPSREVVQGFGARCDAAVLDVLQNAELDDPRNPMLEGAHAVWTILEHEPMHHETFSYILHRMPQGHKRRPADYRAPRELPSPKRGRVAEVPAGTATLGARRGAGFAWDNELEQISVSVGAFECDVLPVTNAEWLAFVRDGGPVPSFWIETNDGVRLLGAWETLPLLESAPVWVTSEQARAYATWRGRRVMTEAEYHRAAFGTIGGEERLHPWGNASPRPEHGNFGWQSWDVAAAGSYPAGASAWGIEELVGNGWEHTSTPFAPLPGFEPHPSYPQYSAEFFDGKHYVVKGASPVTAYELVRNSFRNWFYADYPYLYAKFRTVS
ncbi:MAG: SUMF1/EgtB/PvdO family nonheme iron enzyme [Candidatus Eremiobacteraeota bacterium]|nr:SUMF1/EgtB/PvdO family nonheme iron enzyme [Candidatus Eremiobacteraeota bacterium]